ncbi:MAG: TIGR03747 family integrating conjugative element membrane protein [Gammaproteobacteria bacterium]|nr:TIGR03747 family integrating conjugative element membrane protein [Gammaproteobacteria bacterium]
MSSKQTKVEKKGPSKVSPITGPLKLLWQLFLYLFFSIILSTVIDYAGMWFEWWGKDHQLKVLSSDIVYLGNNFTISIFGRSPAELALSISQLIKDYLTFHQYFDHNEFYFFRLVAAGLKMVEPIWQSLVLSTMVIGVRCFIICMSISFFIIVAIVASVDGLVERELRKEGGGIEQSKLYHHAKAWVGRVIVVTPILYLSWPDRINPGIVILPSALIFGLATYVTFSTYKKHL